LHTSFVQLYLETGQIELAVREMQQVPAEAANLAEVLAVGALLDAVQDRNLTEAEYRLRSALQQQPKNVLYYSWLGLVLARQGRVGEGLKMMEDVSRAEMMASNPVFFDQLGDVYSLANDPARARQAWQHALQVFPRTADPADFRKQRIQEKLRA
jgi:predicted negative regulator of RcsB-dependent stress response